MKVELAKPFAGVAPANAASNTGIAPWPGNPLFAKDVPPLTATLRWACLNWSRKLDSPGLEALTVTWLVFKASHWWTVRLPLYRTSRTRWPPNLRWMPKFHDCVYGCLMAAANPLSRVSERNVKSESGALG